MELALALTALFTLIASPAMSVLTPTGVQVGFDKVLERPDLINLLGSWDPE